LRLLADGYESLEARHLPPAVHALTSARNAVPELRDYASYFLAQAHYRAQEYPEASAAAEQVVAFEPVSPLAGRAAVLGARAWLEQDQPRKALALLARAAEDSLPVPEAGFVRARALEAAGLSFDAVAGFQSVYYLYPESPEANEAYAALDRLRTSMGSKYPEPSAELRFERAGRLRDAGEISDARKEYDSIAADFAGAAGELARLRIAALPYFAGEAVQALSRMEGLGRQAGELEAERLYYMVQCNRHLERDDEMAAALDALASAAPASSWRLKALNAASNRYLVKDDPRQYTVFTACAESFPESSEAVMCHWHAAWWAYRHRDPSAGQLLRQHLKLYPASEKAGAAVYYLGRLAEKSGDGAAAVAWYRFLTHRYPNYYYTFATRSGLRALEARGLQPSRQVEELLASIRFPERAAKADLTPDAATTRRIERARLLSRAGLDTWADSELRYAAQNDAKPWPVMLELAEMDTRAGAPDRALRHIKTVLPSYLFMPRDGAPAHFWRMAFPMPYRSLIVKYSSQVGLDPYLVAALIRQESEFNPKALSPSKAVGLMQIMPPVGRELARKVPVRGFRVSQLTSPDTNIRLGTYYFRRLLDSCDGRLEDTLASYNAGRSRVTLWRGWGPFDDTNEFAETIPFTQTRDYVQIILRNAELYRWLYASEPAVPEATAAAKVRPRASAKVSKASSTVDQEEPAKPAKATSKVSARSSKEASTATSESSKEPSAAKAKSSKKGFTAKTKSSKEASADSSESPREASRAKAKSSKKETTSGTKSSKKGSSAKAKSSKEAPEASAKSSKATGKRTSKPSKAKKKRTKKSDS
jgi:soluble lytic murein transglycosylase